MKVNNSDVQYYKGQYCIIYYDEADEFCVGIFNNIWEICHYKKVEENAGNYNRIKTELYRALRRPGHETRMLNGKLMHVYLI